MSASVSPGLVGTVVTLSMTDRWTFSPAVMFVSLAVGAFSVMASVSACFAPV